MPASGPPTAGGHPPLAGKTVLVGGGGRGIGRGIVERLAADGAFVVFGYRQDEQAAAETVSRARLRGGRALAVRANLEHTEEIEFLFEEAERAGGGLDGYVHNAGVMFHAKLADTTEEQFDTIMSLNLKGTFFALQQAARRLRDGGRIVTISSTATVLAQPSQAAYSMSKAAIDQLTRVAAKELAGRGITANTVAPGAVETDELRASMQPSTLERWRRANAFGRMGLPEDVADVVGFLVSADARWVTGQNIRATGGAT